MLIKKCNSLGLSLNYCYSLQLVIPDAAQDEVDDPEHVAPVTHTTPAVSIGS